MDERKIAQIKKDLLDVLERHGERYGREGCVALACCAGGYITYFDKPRRALKNFMKHFTETFNSFVSDGKISFDTRRVPIEDGEPLPRSPPPRPLPAKPEETGIMKLVNKWVQK